jgi:hypothetical protein
MTFYIKYIIPHTSSDSVKKHASVSSLFPRVLLIASRVCCTDRFGTTVCTSLVLLH